MSYFAATMMVISAYQTKRAQDQQDSNASREIGAIEDRNRLVVKSAIRQYRELGFQEHEVLRRTAEAGFSEKINLMLYEGELETAAAAAGAAGSSFNTIMRDLKVTHGRNISSILIDEETSLDNINRQAEAIKDNAIAGQVSAIYDPPSALDKGLGILGAGLQGYALGSQIDQSSAQAAPADQGKQQAKLTVRSTNPDSQPGSSYQPYGY